MVKTDRASRRIASQIVLALALLTAAAFFLSFWGKDALFLGRDDMGLALALSFVVPLSVYAAGLLAVVSAAGALHARVQRRPTRRWLAALGLALSPIVFLLLLDPRL